jgi:hypothetical protein
MHEMGVEEWSIAHTNSKNLLAQDKHELEIALTNKRGHMLSQD